MEIWIPLLIVSVYLIYIIVLIPLEYQSLVELKKQLAEKNWHHNELYANMSFEEQELNFNKQGTIFNWPALFIASMIYKWKHRSNTV